MKKVLFTILTFTAVTFAFAQQKSDDVAKFTTDIIDMGKIPQGTPATVTFNVTNVGKTPLIIESASPTCGCTIGDYTKEPIMPGKAGNITATYNAANMSAFEKHMNVKFAGFDEMKSITIKGEVVSPEEYAKIKGSTPDAVKAEMKSVPAKVKTTKSMTKTKS